MKIATVRIMGNPNSTGFTIKQVTKNGRVAMPAADLRRIYEFFEVDPTPVPTMSLGVTQLLRSGLTREDFSIIKRSDCRWQITLKMGFPKVSA